MAMYKLFLSDFQETTYFLYAIRSELEDYRIAFNINFAFKTKLTRTRNDLDFKGNERFSFPVFKWKDTKLKSNWSLIKNICFAEVKLNGEGLFADSKEKSVTRLSLLEEHASVNYFLKISGINSYQDKALAILNKIPSINMAYKIDVNSLKSKENLILS